MQQPAFMAEIAHLEADSQVLILISLIAFLKMDKPGSNSALNMDNAFKELPQNLKLPAFDACLKIYSEE